MANQVDLYHAPSFKHESFYAEEVTDGYGHREMSRKAVGNKYGNILDDLFMIV